MQAGFALPSTSMRRPKVTRTPPPGMPRTLRMAACRRTRAPLGTGAESLSFSTPVLITALQPPTAMSCASNTGASESVRYPWAMVPFQGDSRCARCTSQWIHWWSPVALAKASIRSWVTATQSLGPSCAPA